MSALALPELTLPRIDIPFPLDKPSGATEVRFFSAGTPSTKGSAKAFVVGRRAIITNDVGQKAKTWAGIVASAAVDAMKGAAPFTEAVEVSVTFYLPRPKAHFTKKGLRPDAPTWVSKKPDADKLARNYLDALVGVVIRDDALIVRLLVGKRYADGSVGASAVVRRA